MEKLNISKFAYRELYYFCLQYDEKRRKKHPDCRIIESAAREAAEGSEACYAQLMKNVTLGIPYHCLEVPCGKNQFTDMRHKFYYLVAQKTGKI